MKLEELFTNVEIQSEITVCYYDDKREKRVNVQADQYLDHEIKYLYVEDGELFIEVEVDE